MSMELRNLRYLVMLSHRLSYARAAEELGITQSALSRSIQTLEDHFSVRLFDRSRSGVTLTAVGARIVDRAKALLANASDLERSFRDEAAGESGTLSFGMAHVPARALLAGSMAARIQSAPSVRHNVVVRGGDALWPMLVAGELEFLVAPTRIMPEAPPVRVENLGQFPVSLIVRPEHPLLACPDKDLKFPLLSSSESFSSRLVPSELLPGMDGPVQVIEEFDTLIALTKTTDAIWLTSPFAVAHQLATGVLCELIHPGQSPDGHFDVAILSLDWRSQSPAARQMKQALRNQLQTLARQRATTP